MWITLPVVVAPSVIESAALRACSASSNVGCSVEEVWRGSAMGGPRGVFEQGRQGGRELGAVLVPTARVLGQAAAHDLGEGARRARQVGHGVLADRARGLVERLALERRSAGDELEQDRPER